MRWLLLVVSVAAFAFAFGSDSPGALAFALLIGFGALFGSFLGFAAARVGAHSQTQHAREATLVAMSRGKAPARVAPATGAAASRSDTGGGQWIDTGPRNPRDHDHAQPDGGDSGGGDAGGGGNGGGD